MRSARSVRMAAVAVVSVSLLALSACGGDAEEEPKASPTSSSPAEESSEPTEEATEEASETEGASSGEQPEWANPTTTGGDLISTIEVGDITVEVFQVGTTTATEEGSFVDPETKKPLLAEGDEIVFVNYVVTNNGDDIDLGSSLVNISARYDDWQWMQGMDSVTDDALYEEQGVNDGALAAGAYRDPSVYTFGAGQKFSFGENFKYQKGSPITFEAVVTPVDAEGELLHDERQEAEGTGTIA